MLLYLVQHAEAASKEEDPSRSLSEKGIDDINKVAAFAKKLNISVHQIAHSGKMRALQTAQVLEDHITVDMHVLEADGLAPMDDPEIWRERLLHFGNDMMLVGHLPHLGRLASLLLCGDMKRNLVSFETGCIVCLKKADDSGWAVDWVIKPGMVA